MRAWRQLSVSALLQIPANRIVADLAAEQLHRSLPGNAQHRRSWLTTVGALKVALRQPVMEGWTVLLEYPLLRVGKRADVVLLTDRGIFVLEFKIGESGDLRSAVRQADDYAQDLFDFHAGCRSHPIVPVAVTTQPAPHSTDPLLLWHNVVKAQHCMISELGAFLDHTHAAIGLPRVVLDANWWLAQPYRPIPGIVEAARMAFARQIVPDINATRADGGALRRTITAILAEIAEARSRREHRIVFVTGIPGAGKTRCGLAVAFETPSEDRAVFLTGNPSLVHVFREALARDAIAGGVAPSLARQRMEQRIQALPAFRDHHVATDHVPDEHVIVIDEAQRSWNRPQAIRKTRDRPYPLTDSEPGHILDAMTRHSDWAVIVALVGNGQEIHDGEGGLAEWAESLRARPRWTVAAADDVSQENDKRQQLPRSLITRRDPGLHLDVAVRQIGGGQAAVWVDAVLRNDVPQARRLAASAPLPFRLTRDLAAMRAALRHRIRGLRRAGIVASSGAKRLRAEGLGVELPHMDAGAVARWFLDRWPEDVRASDALEVVATEFSCQGLELDHVGMAWGGDLVRDGHLGWRVQSFVGTKWHRSRQAEAISNQINTYRVLLTRARYDTIIYVPRGAAEDSTRSPAEFDAIADFLLTCGVPPLDMMAEAMPGPAIQAALL